MLVVTGALYMNSSKSQCIFIMKCLAYCAFVGQVRVSCHWSIIHELINK